MLGDVGKPWKKLEIIDKSRTHGGLTLQFMVLLVKKTVLFGGNLELQERRSSYCNDTPCSEAPKKYIHHFHQFSVRQIFRTTHTFYDNILSPYLLLLFRSMCCLPPQYSEVARLGSSGERGWLSELAAVGGDNDGVTGGGIGIVWKYGGTISGATI